MITINQCRAARGLLDWTQQDLADASGLSKTAINNFEKGHSDIKMESLRAIRMAFESADIEFIDENGLRKKSERAYFLKGDTAFEELLEDILSTMAGKQGEVLSINKNETVSGQTTQKALLEFREKLRKIGVHKRTICTNSHKTLGEPLAKRRWLDEAALFSLHTTYIYDRKVAFQLYDQSMIVVLDSREAYESERVRFEKLWHMAYEQNEDAQNSPAKASS